MVAFLHFTSFDSLACYFGFSGPLIPHSHTLSLSLSPKKKEKEKNQNVDSLSKFTYKRAQNRVVGFLLKQ